jgi:hypothetical protein
MPRLRRSMLLNCIPALPGWAHFWLSALRALSGFVQQPLFMEASLSPLSSRPERSRIFYFAAIHGGHVCGSP